MNPVDLYWRQCCRQWNIPNSITLSRSVLGFVSLSIWGPGNEVWLISILVYAGISDGLDGWLARRQGVQTPIGAVFDPLADKCFTNPVLIAIAFSTGGTLAWALFVVNLLYDADNTYQRRGDIFKALAGRPGEASKPVTKLSKWKTASLFVFMVLAVISEWFPAIPLQLAAGVCLLLVLWSWCLNRRSWLAQHLR